MGWSFRRSVKMGPLRVNFSGTGIGVSAGVRGARVNVGPRGTYVNFGLGGFHYRKKLRNPTRQEWHAIEQSAGNITTASVAELAQASPEWMVQDSQLRLRRWNLFKAFCWTAAPALLYLWASASGSVTLVALLLLVGGGVAVHRWDSERRTSRVFYDVDSEEIVERLAMANGAGQWLGSCQALWHVFHAVQTSDWKKNAGAGTLIRRTPTRCRVGALPGFELNVEVWCVPAGPQQLLLLPDRLLVWDGTQLAALPYETISARASATRFIEDGAGVPSDAQQIDTTWRFVRRDGGPDLRFANNAQLPVMRYGELELTTASGFRIILQTSTVDAAEGAARALSALASRASFARAPATPPTALPIQRHTSAPPQSSLPAPSPPQQTAKSVATLLRYLASADRRIDSKEIILAEKVLGELLPSGHPELASLVEAFRTLPTDSSSVAAAQYDVASLGPEFCQWVARSLSDLANADGKTTPKELERLTEIRQALGV
jgi:hypothetical protein